MDMMCMYRFPFLLLRTVLLRFSRCCERALKAALQLVAFTSEKTEKQLEADYRKMCRDTPDEPFGQDELDCEEVEEAMEKAVCQEECADPVFNLVTAIQRETVFNDPEEGCEEPANRSGMEDPDIDSMADKVEIKELLKEPGVEDHNNIQEMPSTLLEAMQSRGCTWNALFRLIVRLRSAPGGCDTRWVPHARHVRRTSLKLNWHQCLGCAYHFVVIVCDCMYLSRLLLLVFRRNCLNMSLFVLLGNSFSIILGKFICILGL